MSPSAVNPKPQQTSILHHISPDGNQTAYQSKTAPLAGYRRLCYEYARAYEKRQTETPDNSRFKDLTLEKINAKTKELEEKLQAVVERREGNSKQLLELRKKEPSLLPFMNERDKTVAKIFCVDALVTQQADEISREQEKNSLLDEKVRQLQVDLEKAKQLQVDLEKANTSKDKEVAASKTARQQLIDQLQSTNLQLQQNLCKVNASKDEEVTSRKSKQKFIEELQSTNQRLQNDLTQAQIETLQSRYDDLSRRYKDRQETVAGECEMLNMSAERIPGLKDETETLRASYNDLQRQQRDLQITANRIPGLEATIGSYSSQCEILDKTATLVPGLQAEIKTQQSKYDSLLERHRELQVTAGLVPGLQDKVNRLSDECKELRTSAEVIPDLRLQIESLTSQVTNLNNELRDVRQSIMSTSEKSMEDGGVLQRNEGSNQIQGSQGSQQSSQLAQSSQQHIEMRYRFLYDDVAQFPDIDVERSSLVSTAATPALTDVIERFLDETRQMKESLFTKPPKNTNTSCLRVRVSEKLKPSKWTDGRQYACGGCRYAKSPCVVKLQSLGDTMVVLPVAPKHRREGEGAATGDLARYVKP